MTQEKSKTVYVSICTHVKTRATKAYFGELVGIKYW